MTAALCIHGHAGHAELIDVAIDRAHGDFQLTRQRFGAHTTARLQDDENRQESAGAHARQTIPDARWQASRSINDA